MIGAQCSSAIGVVALLRRAVLPQQVTDLVMAVVLSPAIGCGLVLGVASERIRRARATALRSSVLARTGRRCSRWPTCSVSVSTTAGCGCCWSEPPRIQRNTGTCFCII
jgi:hypothetical protein